MGLKNPGSSRRELWFWSGIILLALGAFFGLILIPVTIFILPIAHEPVNLVNVLAGGGLITFILIGSGIYCFLRWRPTPVAKEAVSYPNLVQREAYLLKEIKATRIMVHFGSFLFVAGLIPMMSIVEAIFYAVREYGISSVNYTVVLNWLLLTVTVYAFGVAILWHFSRRLKQLEKEKDEIYAHRRCRHCNAELSKEDLFCPKCGAIVPS